MPLVAIVLFLLFLAAVALAVATGRPVRERMALPDEAIRTFWTAWARERPRVGAALESRELAALVEPITRLVKAIDPQLVWELGPGARARHVLCVSANGDIVRRRITRRWRELGPADDDTFEYRDARGGMGLSMASQLRFGDHDIPCGDFVFAISLELRRSRVHLGVWHPAFAQMDKAARASLAFVMLDALLGEDDVERWIGRVDVLEAATNGAVDLDAVLTAVADARAVRETGAVLEGRGDGGAPLIATVDLGIKRVDHVELDTHLQVSIAFGSARGPSAMPDAEIAAGLNAAEDALVSVLEREGLFIGRETAAGERVLHLHVRHTIQLEADVRAWAKGVRWKTTPRFASDPKWTVLERW
jgi:hypothetical protein